MMSDDDNVTELTAVPEPTGPARVRLSTPIRAHGEEVSELVMSGNPTLRHLKGVRVKIGPGGLDIDLGDIPAVISPMAAIPLSAAEKISIRDLGKLLPVVMDFFDVSL